MSPVFIADFWTKNEKQVKQIILFIFSKDQQFLVQKGTPRNIQK